MGAIEYAYYSEALQRYLVDFYGKATIVYNDGKSERFECFMHRVFEYATKCAEEKKFL